MKHWQSVLFCTLFVTACDDELDLRLPEGQLPDAPIAVVFHPENADYLELRWTKIPRAVGYHIYTSTVSESEFVRIASVRDTVWRHELSQAFADQDNWAATRFYRVTSVVDSSESNFSGQVGAIAKSLTAPFGPAIQAGTPLSIPLTAWVRDPSGVPIPRTTSFFPQDVFGDELDRGEPLSADVLTNTEGDSSLFTYRDATGVWHGSYLQTGLKYTDTYYILRYHRVTKRIYICGRVVNGDVPPVWIQGPEVDGRIAITPYSWRESRRITVWDLGLLEAGFQSGNAVTADRISDLANGEFTYFSARDSKWLGSLTRIQPGRVYVFVLKHAGGFNYTYNAPS